MATSYMDLLNMQPPGSGGSPGVVDLTGAGPIQAGASTLPPLSPTGGGTDPNTFLANQGRDAATPEGYKELSDMIAAFESPLSGHYWTRPGGAIHNYEDSITDPEQLRAYRWSRFGGYDNGLVGPLGDTRSKIRTSKSGTGNWCNTHGQNPDWDEATGGSVER